MYWLRRLTYVGICIAVFIVLVAILPTALNPDPPSPRERRRDKQWVASSPYWLDRQACRWFSLCGLHHLRWDPPALPTKNESTPEDDGEFRRLELRKRWEAWPEEEIQSKRWTHAERGRREHTRSEPHADFEKPRAIPEYVLAHAPLVHLYSGENFWPSDIAEHIQHMKPYTQGGPANNHSLPLDLNDLDLLNGEHGMVFLTSDDDVETRPEWLHSHHGIPKAFNDGDGIIQGPLPETADPPRLAEGTTWYDVDRSHPLERISDPRKLEGIHRAPAPGRTRPSGLRMRRKSELPNLKQHPLVSDDSPDASTSGHKPEDDGYSKAPAVLVLVDKGSGILDAFWFFFYSYNLGQTVLGVRYGNHVGDWEHCMVRFEDGVPRALFLSEHAGGQAYAWSALEKYYPDGNKTAPERPIVYSAVGSHAMYAMPGEHPYVLPLNLLRDVTDRGPLWDPAKNNYAFWYDYVLDREEERHHHKHKGPDGAVEHNSLTPAAENPDLATGWFHFVGPWGDALYGLGDPRQWRLFGQYHYVTGPEGPKAKHLDRSKVCQTDRCRILWSLDAGSKGTWYS